MVYRLVSLLSVSYVMIRVARRKNNIENKKIKPMQFETTPKLQFDIKI